MLLALDSSLLLPRLLELRELRGGFGWALCGAGPCCPLPAPDSLVASPVAPPGASNTKLEQGLPEVIPKAVVEQGLGVGEAG